MVERSGCSIEDDTNGASLHNDVSTRSNFIPKNSFQSLELNNNTHNNRFSLFKWFKRNDNTTLRSSNHQKNINDEENVSEDISSTESINTYYSTTTVKSFAFHSGTIGILSSSTSSSSSSPTSINLNIIQKNQRCVGPFASGASKVIGKIGNNSTNVTQTLPSNVSSRSCNITTRYSLQSCTASGIRSCNNLNINNHQYELSNKLKHRSFNNYSGERKLHVRGKRRAPNPPIITHKPKSVCVTNVVSTGSGYRKRRKAPQPPSLEINTKNSVTNVMDIDGNGATADNVGEDEDGDKKNVKTNKIQSEINFKNISLLNKSDEIENTNENQQSVSTDTLILRDGVLLPKHDNKTSINLPTNNSIGLKSFGIDKPKDIIIPSSTNSSAMPRPWYKRSVFENSSKKFDNSRISMSNEIRDSTSNDINLSSIKTNNNHDHHQLEKYHNESTLSRLKFFNRDKNNDDKKKDIKRRSGLLILTNISELDKEAAAIVQEEQARSRALLMKQASLINNDKDKFSNDNQHDVIQNIVTSTMESSPRRSTRALISKFNAISNITKVTVNSNFFNRNISTKDPCNLKLSNDNFRTKITPEINLPSSSNKHPDLSRYFPKHDSTKVEQRYNENTKNSIDTSRLLFLRGTTDNVPTKVSEMKVEKKDEKYEKHNIITDVTNRLSVLQSVVKKNSSDDLKHSSPITTRSSIKSDKQSIINQNNHDDNINNSDDNIPPEIKKIVGTSSQVNKVLDILVETEKIERNNSLDPLINQKADIKPKILNTVEDQTTIELKEMLKEMKHSLPKRPKPKDIDKKLSTKIATNVNQMNDIKFSNSDSLNHVKIIYPPIIHTAPSITSMSSTSNLCNNIKQQNKVSSGVQTSGNVRRILASTSTVNNSDNSAPGQHEVAVTAACDAATAIPSTSQTKYDDITYKSIRNKFQLMRPREFAAIGAIKTLKKSKNNNNTYANVIEQSLYANALVLPSRNHEIIPNNISWNNCKKKLKSPVPFNNYVDSENCDDNNHDDNKPQLNVDNHVNKIFNNSSSLCIYPRTNEHKEDKRTMAQHQMNTMAVNRLIKKLEGAIATGNHEQASKFAKELATLKIECSVIRHRAKCDDLLNVDMYIEDRLAHQGPIPLHLPMKMTVAELKEKISNDFDIPPNVQRWIINNTLAENNLATLEELHTTDGSPLFLYLVAPDLQIVDPEKPILALDSNNIPQSTYNDIDYDDNNDFEKRSKKKIITKYIKVNNQLPDYDVEEKEIVVPIKLVASNNTLDTVKVEVDKQNIPEIVNIDHHLKLNKLKINDENLRINDIEIVDDIENLGAIALKKNIEPEGYKELIMLESCDIVPNTKSIECPICFLKYDPFEGILLRGCLHAFCRVCLVNTIKHCDDAEVKCPYGDATYSCESAIQEREIKALVDPDTYELHLAKSISQAESSAGENAFHCKTPDCVGWCLYDDKPNHFLCPVCNKTNCLTCRVIHEGKNCLEYQDEIRLSKETDHESKRTAAMLANMLDRGEAMKCPRCNVLLMKKMGCDWLKCSMCKTEICWITKGPRWGIDGPGDISGGCRCNVNGIKCHPNCNYCH